MCALKSAFKTKGKLSLLTALPALSNFLWILTDYSMILLISGINYPELSQTPRYGLNFTRLLPHFRCQSQVVSFKVTHTSVSLGYNPLLRFGNLLLMLTEPKEMPYLLLSVYYKGYNIIRIQYYRIQMKSIIQNTIL